MWVPEEATFEPRLEWWELSDENCYHDNNQTHTEKVRMYFINIKYA